MEEGTKSASIAVVTKTELDNIKDVIRENTVALIEMGVVLTQLRNKIDHIFSKVRK